MFDCEDHITYPGVMTLAIQILDASGRPGDCIVYGHDPEAMNQNSQDRVADPEFSLDGCRVR